jgi:uncharacterized membrane protein YhaH (DUF805 family)
MEVYFYSDEQKGSPYIEGKSGGDFFKDEQYTEEIYQDLPIIEMKKEKRPEPTLFLKILLGFLFLMCIVQNLFVASNRLMGQGRIWSWWLIFLPLAIGFSVLDICCIFHFEKIIPLSVYIKNTFKRVALQMSIMFVVTYIALFLIFFPLKLDLIISFSVRLIMGFICFLGAFFIPSISLFLTYLRKSWSIKAVR